MKNVLGPRIRETRLAADPPVSQEELVARLQASGVDLDQSALSRIENGERHITDIEIIAVCKVLSITVAQMFGGAEPR
jgi:transcriptional regulator with XRE-family HTH domain